MDPGTELHTQLPPRPPWRDRFVGLDEMLPLFDGRLAPYINLDNAASTPPLRDVAEAVQRFLPFVFERTQGLGSGEYGRAYNVFDEIDALAEMLERIARNDYRGEYFQVPETGDYRAAGDDQLANTEFHVPMRSSARASTPHFER